MEDHNLLHRYYEAISENNLTELREILLISPNILQHQVYDVNFSLLRLTSLLINPLFEHL